MSRSNTASGPETSRPPFDRAAAMTRSLLGYGVLAGALYLGVGIVQGLFRDGDEFACHDLSLLASRP